MKQVFFCIGVLVCNARLGELSESNSKMSNFVKFEVLKPFRFDFRINMIFSCFTVHIHVYRKKLYIYK